MNRRESQRRWAMRKIFKQIRTNLRFVLIDELTAKSFSIARMNVKARRINEPTASLGLAHPLFFEVGRVHDLWGSFVRWKNYDGRRGDEGQRRFKFERWWILSFCEAWILKLRTAPPALALHFSGGARSASWIDVRYQQFRSRHLLSHRSQYCLLAHILLFDRQPWTWARLPPLAIPMSMMIQFTLKIQSTCKNWSNLTPWLVEWTRHI